MYIVRKNEFIATSPRDSDYLEIVDEIFLKGDYEFVVFDEKTREKGLITKADPAKLRILYNEETQEDDIYSGGIITVFQRATKIGLSKLKKFPDQHLYISRMGFCRSGDAWIDSPSMDPFIQLADKRNLLFYGKIHGNRDGIMNVLALRGLKIKHVNVDINQEKLAECMIRNECFAVLAIDGASLGCWRDWETALAGVPALRVTQGPEYEFVVNPAGNYLTASLADDLLEKTDTLAKTLKDGSLAARLKIANERAKAITSDVGYYEAMDAVVCDWDFLTAHAKVETKRKSLPEFIKRGKKLKTIVDPVPFRTITAPKMLLPELTALPCKTYSGVHKHWKDLVIFDDTRTFRRKFSSQSEGTWMFDGKTLTLKWYMWPEEKTTLGLNDRFSGDVELVPVEGIKHQAKKPTTLEAVIVCKNFSDFLSVSLPLNKKHMDHIVVVTEKNDIETQRVCALNSVPFVFSDRFTLGGPFNMGAATNDGFNALQKKDWIVRLDADTILPEDFGEKIRQMNMDDQVLYGCPRIICSTEDEWNEYLKTGKYRNKEVAHVGSGYFQLFNVRAWALKGRTEWYSNSFPTAGGVDLEFRSLWGNLQMTKTLDFPVVHLGSTGVHWSGRDFKFNWSSKRQLTQEEEKAVGKYSGTHKDWNGYLELDNTGAFFKDGALGGKWRLSNGLLELNWNKWPKEVLRSTNFGFQGKGIFTLKILNEKSFLSLQDRGALATKFCKGKRCAEVGVFQGGYAKVILSNSPESLLLIDPWCRQDEKLYPPEDLAHVSTELFEEYYNEVKKLEGPNTKLLRTTSAEAAKNIPDESLDFVFIDAIHTEEAVRKDASIWWPKIAPGGWLCGHDYTAKWEKQVQAGIDGFMKDHGLERIDLLTCESPASWGFRKRGSILIPRVLHQIWIGQPPNDKIQASMQSWVKTHPDWKRILWTDNEKTNIPGWETRDISTIELQNRDAFNSLSSPSKKSNILRLEIIYQFGGVYVDSDTDNQKPIDFLIDGLDSFTAMSPAGINNSFFGATPKHCWIKSMLDSIPKVSSDQIKFGPPLMKLASLEYCIPCFNAWAVSPYRWDQSRSDCQDAWIVHWWNSWEPEEYNISETEKKIVGKYFAYHKQWRGEIDLQDNGIFRRWGEDHGKWSFDGHSLVLRWYNWPHETVVIQDDGSFFSPAMTIAKYGSPRVKHVQIDGNFTGLGDKIAALVAVRAWAKMNPEHKVFFSHIPDVVNAYGDNIVNAGTASAKIDLHPFDKHRAKNYSPDQNGLGTFMSSLGIQVPTDAAPCFDLPVLDPDKRLDPQSYIAIQPYSTYAEAPPCWFVQETVDKYKKLYPDLRFVIVGKPDTPKNISGVEYDFLEDSALLLMRIIRHAKLVITARSASANIAAGYGIPTLIMSPLDGEDWHIEYPSYKKKIISWKNSDFFIQLPKTKIKRVSALRRLDQNNAGDKACSPLSYFDFGVPVKHIDIAAKSFETDDETLLLVGGGGLFYFRNEIARTQYAKNMAIWGAGLNKEAKGFDEYPKWVFDKTLVGVRDMVSYLRWVPCPSCMHPLFDQDYKIEHEVVVYSHKDHQFNIGDYPSLTNNTNIENALKLLGSGRTVVTNTYHGAYWGALLGRRVLILDPWSSKFDRTFFGTVCNMRNWQEQLQLDFETKNWLGKCRLANQMFFNSIKETYTFNS